MKQTDNLNEEWTDEEFCKALGFTAGTAQDICQKIREKTAEICALRKEQISSHADTERLAKAARNGWDNLEIVMALEADFRCPIPLDLPNFTLRRFFCFFKEPKPVSYGTWVTCVVKQLTPVIESRGE